VQHHLSLTGLDSSDPLGDRQAVMQERNK